MAITNTSKSKEFVAGSSPIILKGDYRPTKMASAPDPMDERNTVMENIAIQEFGRPLKDLSEDEIIQIEEMMDNMSSMPDREAPSITLADGGRAGFKSGSYDYNSFEHKINELKAAFKRYKKGSATGGRKGTMTFEQFAPKFAEENFSTGGRVQAASGGLAEILKV